MTLSATIKATISAQHTKVIDLGTASMPIELLKALTLTDGTGANQADRIFTDTRTLSASANEDLDLAGGSLVDVFGNALTFARIKALFVTADAGNTNNVNVSRPAANGVPLYLAAGDGEAVHPGSCILKAWPGVTAIPVTAGTGDLINFANSGAGTPVTYTVIIIGASA